MKQDMSLLRSIQVGARRISPSLLVFLFFAAIYIFTMSGWFEYGGEIEKYRVAQSIVDRQSFAIRPIVTRGATGSSGQTFSIYEFGQIALEIPFYILGRIAYTYFPTPDVNWITLLFVGMLDPLITALTCVVLFKTIISLGFREKTALVITCLFGLSTIAWTYSRGIDREPVLSFLILMSFYTCWRFAQTQSKRWLVLAGGIAGYLVFTKFIQAMVLPFLLVYIIAAIYQKQKTLNVSRRSIIRAMTLGLFLFLLPAIIFMLFQVLYAYSRFGTFYSGIGGTSQNIIDVILREMSLSNVSGAIVGLLFSPERSIFLYSPPILLFLFTWRTWYQRQKPEALLVLGLVLIEFLSTITRQEWWGGPRWGPRYMVQATPLFLLPLGVIEWKRGITRRGWIAAGMVLFMLGILVQIAGVFTNERDTGDLFGGILSFASQVDFLWHGALSSLMIYLAPGSFALNPFGILLLALALVLGWGLLRHIGQEAAEVSARWNWGLLITILIVTGIAFVFWIVAPYQNIMAARGNTRFTAAENFLADNRACEATGLYVSALEWPLTFQHQAIERYQQIMPRTNRKLIPIDDPLHWIDITGTAKFEYDPNNGVGDAPSLRFSQAIEQDATILITSGPLPGQSNTVYELSGWLKSKSIYGSGRGVVTLEEDDGNWGNKQSTDIASMDETHGWQPFRDVITTTNTTQRLFVKMGLYQTWGTLWIDGVRLVQVGNRLPQSYSTTLNCTR